MQYIQLFHMDVVTLCLMPLFTLRFKVRKEKAVHTFRLRARVCSADNREAE